MRRGILGLLLVTTMILTPHVAEYVKDRIDAAHSVRADARTSEPSGLAPALAGFAIALGPTPARNSGEDARSLDEVHGIKVEGPAWFKKQVEQALNLLKKKDPENYRLVVENLTEIRADRSIEPGVFAMVDPATGVVYYKPWRDELPASMAATLAHEAMHVYAYRHGLPYSGEEGEDLAYEKQNEVAYRLTRK